MPSYLSTVVLQVAQLKAAGAHVLAKTNLAEWAFTAVKSIGFEFGTVCNPYDLNHTPARSSGGTAAAVVANLGLIGEGLNHTINLCCYGMIYITQLFMLVV